MEKNVNNKYFTFEKLNNFENLIHFFTKKPFNFNENIINKEDILNNYKIIEKDFDCDFIKIKKSIQSHTNNIKIVTKNNLDEDFYNIDGMITDLTNIALVTYTADCQAILLFDPNKNIIANIHSGWKGTLNKIIENAIVIMKNEFGCNAKDIISCICPSILDCCFEVDEDVILMFKNNFNNYYKYISTGKKINNKQKNFIDIVSINVDIMKKLGVKEENIICSNICTKCNSNIFHSYRSDKDKSGRNIAFIGLKKI